jgi:tetratricopeptide (TPR) repeat protein
MIDLGALLYRREKFAEAERFLEKGVTFLRKQNETQGGRFNAVKLAHALDQLGGVKLYRGDVKASRGILEEALQVATRALPDERDHSVLTNIKTDLGGLLVLVGELKRGEILLQESFAESRTTRTSTPQWEAGITLQMLGELALARNRAREAGESFLDAELIYRETLGEKNLYFARNLERRATVLLMENDLSSAEDLAQRSLAIAKECSPENKLPLTDPMMTLSNVLIKEGRLTEGEEYLRKTIRICEDQSIRNYAAIALAKIRLSQLFLSQHRFTEAENVAFEIHSQARQHLEPQDPMRKAAANNLIEIYEAQEKHEAARAVK